MIKLTAMKKAPALAFAVILFCNCIAQPPNDDPCGAIPLIVQTGSYCTPSNPYSWTGATSTTLVPPGSCGGSSAGDIWFSFFTPASGKVNINTAAGTGPGAVADGVMEVWGNSAGCATPTFFFITCNDDRAPGQLMPYLSLTLTPGLYYIRFWPFNGATSGNIGGICVTDPNPPLATTGAVGIGIQNPDTLLDVNGMIKIRGGNPGLNKVLTSDADGKASWVAPATAFDPIPFKGTHSTTQIISSGTPFVLDFNTEEYDPAGNFAAGTFSAPAAGIYHFTAAVDWSLTGITSATNISVTLKISGTNVHSVSFLVPAGGNGEYTQVISADLPLTLFQTVQVAVFQTSGSSQTVNGNTIVGKFSYFSGFRIK